MADFNKVFLLGRLTRDPELRYTKGGTPLAEFGLAVNHEYTDSNNNKVSKPCFVEILTWRKTAELVSQYLSKGSQVFLEGRLQLDTWESQDGQKRSKLLVVAENIQFLGAPRNKSGASGEKSEEGGSRYAEKAPVEERKPAAPVEDDDIPF